MIIMIKKLVIPGKHPVGRLSFFRNRHNQPLKRFHFLAVAQKKPDYRFILFFRFFLFCS